MQMQMASLIPLFVQSGSLAGNFTPSQSMVWLQIRMCIPSCYSLPPYLVVTVRSTKDDVRLDIEINLLVIISVLVFIQN